MLDFLLQWAKSVQLSGKKHSGVSIYVLLPFFLRSLHTGTVAESSFLDPHLFVPEQNAPPTGAPVVLSLLWGRP